VFDKTGTLTTGRLRLAGVQPLENLTAVQLRTLHQLVVRSGHPKSAAVAEAIPEAARFLDPTVVVDEVAGAGVETRVSGVAHRLGSPSFAAPNEPTDGDVVFAADGHVLAVFRTEEILRPDAAAEVAELTREGFEVWMLTGDGEARARTLATTAGIEPAHVVSGETPQGKADWLREHDRGHVLFLGDGINDAPAAALAHCSGTPAAGRTFLASRSDFYLLGDGLAGVRLALRGARALRARTRGNLKLAVLYNAIALGLCFGGFMSPLAAAVLMPVSSILAVSLTVRDLSRKDASWKS